MHTLERLREAHPELFSVQTIVSGWGEMASRYIAAVKEGARKMVRMLPETVRKGEFRRKALTPMADGRSRWEFPTTFFMDNATGFWQSIAIPSLEEKAPRNTWLTFLGMQSKRPASGGSECNTNDQCGVVPRIPIRSTPPGYH